MKRDNRITHTKAAKKRTAAGCFSLHFLIRPEGRIILSPERSKLCFEALETIFVPQNYLPCRGLKTCSEVAVF
jgi:hypothetical protein